MAAKEYTQLIDRGMAAGQKRRKNKRKFVAFLSQMKLNGFGQFTSRINYYDSGLELTAYYLLPEEKNI